MVESIVVTAGASRQEAYAELVPQIDSVIAGTDDLIANLANVAAILKEAFNFHWVGFYRATKVDELTLGPFQGPVACVTIPFAKGVCGMAARERRTVIVPDVEKFDGHIACSSLSRSEIVVPLVQDARTRLVLDIDSDKADDFDSVDQDHLEKIMRLLDEHHPNIAA